MVCQRTQIFTWNLGMHSSLIAPFLLNARDLTQGKMSAKLFKRTIEKKEDYAKHLKKTLKTCRLSWRYHSPEEFVGGVRTYATMQIEIHVYVVHKLNKNLLNLCWKSSTDGTNRRRTMSNCCWIIQLGYWLRPWKWKGMLSCHRQHTNTK